MAKASKAPVSLLPAVITPANQHEITPANQPERDTKRLANIPLDKRGKTTLAVLPDRQEHASVSLEKHGASLRHKAAYIADCLAEDIIRVFRKSGKKDKEYLKGLLWSFGVAFDKATGGTSGEAVTVHIPAKLLDNVKAVIAIQAARKAKPIDVTPPALDTASSAPPIETMS